MGNQRRDLPQGAILSPILYNIYTADITKEIDTSRAKVLQYVDDIGIYTTSNARDKNIEAMENAVKVIIDNLKKIKLEVSEEKSTIINFTTKNNSRRREKCAVTINGVAKEEKKSTKFLGIILDNKLKFEEHITEVGLKANRRLTMLRYIGHIKKGANPETMVAYINKALIRSVVEYGINIYCSENNRGIRDKIKKIQNAEVRMAMGYRMFTPINVIMSEAGVMDMGIRRRLIFQRYMTKQGTRRYSESLTAMERYAETIEEGEEALEENIRL